MVTSRNGSVRRAAKLMNLGFGLAGSYLGYQLQRRFLNGKRADERRQALTRKSAKQIRERLQDLRGPIMKVGQILSMQSHALDPALIEELSALQMQAPPMHPSLMRAQFKTAFGSYPEAVFRSFEEQPFAAASLGQVHWAVTKGGEEVAVKIQYPAMREAIESDFQALRAAGLLARLTGHLKESIIRETERGILEETDYVNEARNMEYFCKALAPLDFIRVPTAHPELSSSQVLTMSRMKGLRLLDFLKTNPSQELRDSIGAGLMRLFFFQLFRVGALHADPHPGNYLLNDDGAISLVDFGCVKHLKPAVVRCYAQFWSRQWVHDSRLFAEIVRVCFGPSVSPRQPHVRRCMNEIKALYDEFHPLEKPARVLDFSRTHFMDSLGKLAVVLIKGKFLSPEFVFLSRTELGMCNMLHSLKARLATTPIALQWMPPI